MNLLLNTLVADEKKNDRNLYSSGPYWDYKNSRTLIELKKKGLKDFRGLSSSVGSSFADNLTVDIRDEFNLKGRIVSKLFSLPLINTIFSEQLELTKDHIKSYLLNQSIVYEKNTDVLRLLAKYKFHKTTEFGCVQKFKVNKIEYSSHYLIMADRIDKLSKNFDFSKIKNYFEIGGGFGANLHFLLQNFPNIKKILYLDTVPNIFVGTEYLRTFFKDKVKDYLTYKDSKSISFTNDNELEIICIPAWEIEKVDVEIDHFHNAASFVEMHDDAIKNYYKYIKKFKTKEISLIDYERPGPQITFDPPLLNKFFDNKLNLTWQNSLIKEYDRKILYFTSK